MVAVDAVSRRPATTEKGADLEGAEDAQHPEFVENLKSGNDRAALGERVQDSEHALATGHDAEGQDLDDLDEAFRRQDAVLTAEKSTDDIEGATAGAAEDTADEAERATAAEEAPASEDTAEQTVTAQQIAANRKADAFDGGVGVVTPEKAGVSDRAGGGKTEGKRSRDDQRAARRFDHVGTPSGGLRFAGAQQI